MTTRPSSRQRRGVAARSGREHEGRLPLLQARDSVSAGAGRRLGDQRRAFVAILGAATSQISYTASKGAVLSMSRELGCSSRARACG